MMNERLDSDDDEDIAAGRLLPPATMITVLSAFRGIISRLFFLNTPSTPSPASIMLVDLSQSSGILSEFAANDWTCGEIHVK